MADDGVRAGADQLVVGADGGVETQVFAEGVRGGPGEECSEGKEDDTEDDAPVGWMQGPEMALP